MASATNSTRTAFQRSCTALFNLDGNRLLVRKPSGHGLGFLQAPYSIADWQRRTGRKWNEELPPWIFEAWHLILSRELGLPHVPPRWLKQPAAMAVPITTPQVLERLGRFKDELRPFTVVTVPFPKKEVGQLWTGFFIMPYAEKLDNLHGRPMVNVVSGGTFYIHDKNSSTLPKPSGWLVSEDDGRRNQSSSVQSRGQVLHSQRRHVHQQDNRPACAQAYRCWGVSLHRQGSINALGERARSIHDGRSGGPGPDP